MKSFNTVGRRIEAKKDFVTSHECDEKVPLIDFIEQRKKSDPVAREMAVGCGMNVSVWSSDGGERYPMGSKLPA